MAWIVIASVITVALLLVGTLSVANALFREEETITTMFDEPGVGLIDIDLGNGSITLVASGEGPITVTANLTHGLRRSEQQVDVVVDRLVTRETCNGPPLTVFCRAEYILQVPTRVGAVLRSGNGSILVTGIGGAVDASSSNGSVAVNQTSGDLRLRSSNGRVEATASTSGVVKASSRNGRVSLSFDDAPRDVRAESANGRVEIVLPDTEDAYLVDASSDNGSVNTPVRADPSSSRRILAESNNGNVTVRYPSR